MGTTIIGSEELIRDLQALARRAPEAAAKGLYKGAKEIVGRAKADTQRRTGRAARSIHVGGHPELSGDFDPGRDGKWYFDMGEYRAPSASGAGVQIGSTLFYFRWIEDGGPHNAAQRPVGRAVDSGAELVTRYLHEEADSLATELNL